MTQRLFALSFGSFLFLLGPAAFADQKEKKTLTVAHIKLSGGLDEKPPMSDPLLGQLGETFKQKLDRIKKAKTDKNVAALLLEINGLSAGWGKVNELSRAIADFRSSGKKAFAFVESGASRDYLLALACDEVCLPEAGWLMLTGIRMEASFYKDLLDKVGVKADMLHMGDFKGAAEPFTRTSLSEPNRKQMTLMLDDFYDNEIVGRIVQSRQGKKLTAGKVKELIDDGPYTARDALKAGLVDRVNYLDSYKDTLKGVLKADEVKVAQDYGKKKDEDLDILSLYAKLAKSAFLGGKTFTLSGPKVAVIYASGAIVTGKSGGGLMSGETVGSETLVSAIRDAEEDKNVKAIVLRVDSPGGSALASDLIWNELKRSKKPVIASMSDVAASGGYYISMAAKKIYAEPGTITGSIGVVGGKMALGGLYDKVGIKTQVLSRGKNSGVLSTTDPFSPSEREVFRKLMADVYDQFVDKALEGRVKAGKKMTREELLGLAGGRIWTGRQAKEKGLIDELGTLDDAIACAAKLGGLPADKEPELLMLPKPKNTLESLLGSAFNMQVGLEAQLGRKVPELAETLRGVEAVFELRREPVWAILPFRVEVK